MPEKDPTSYPLITYSWVVLLSAWGGIVSWMRKRANGSARPYNVAEFVGEVLTSAFSGLVTFWLCEASVVNPLLTAAMVAISGHMGTRALFQLERIAERRFGVGVNDER